MVSVLGTDFTALGCHGQTVGWNTRHDPARPECTRWTSTLRLHGPYCFLVPCHAVLGWRLGVGRDHGYAGVRRSPEHFTLPYHGQTGQGGAVLQEVPHPGPAALSLPVRQSPSS